MITVRLGEYMVDARGHAGSGPVGSDLVCCAVTTILYALIQGLSCLPGADITTWDMSPGNGHVEAMGVPPEGEGMFMMAQSALKNLAAKFPDYVRISDEPFPTYVPSESKE